MPVKAGREVQQIFSQGFLHPAHHMRAAEPCLKLGVCPQLVRRGWGCDFTTQLGNSWAVRQPLCTFPWGNFPAQTKGPILGLPGAALYSSTKVASTVSCGTREAPESLPAVRGLCSLCHRSCPFLGYNHPLPRPPLPHFYTVTAPKAPSP